MLSVPYRRLNVKRFIIVSSRHWDIWICARSHDTEKINLKQRFFIDFSLASFTSSTTFHDFFPFLSLYKPGNRCGKPVASIFGWISAHDTYNNDNIYDFHYLLNWQIWQGDKLEINLIQRHSKNTEENIFSLFLSLKHFATSPLSYSQKFIAFTSSCLV